MSDSSVSRSSAWTPAWSAGAEKSGTTTPTPSPFRTRSRSPTPAFAMHGTPAPSSSPSFVGAHDRRQTVGVMKMTPAVMRHNSSTTPWCSTPFSSIPSGGTPQARVGAGREDREPRRLAGEVRKGAHRVGAGRGERHPGVGVREELLFEPFRDAMGARALPPEAHLDPLVGPETPRIEDEAHAEHQLQEH